MSCCSLQCNTTVIWKSFAYSGIQFKTFRLAEACWWPFSLHLSLFSCCHYACVSLLLSTEQQPGDLDVYACLSVRRTSHDTQEVGWNSHFLFPSLYSTSFSVFFPLSSCRKQDHSSPVTMPGNYLPNSLTLAVQKYVPSGLPNAQEELF